MPHEASMANEVFLASTAHRVRTARSGLLAPLVRWGRRAGTALRVSAGVLVPMVEKARPAWPVFRASAVFPGRKETSVLVDRMVGTDATVRKGRRVPKALPVRLAGVGHKVKRETREFPGPKEPRVPKALPARKAPEGRKVQRATKVFPG